MVDFEQTFEQTLTIYLKIIITFSLLVLWFYSAESFFGDTKKTPNVGFYKVKNEDLKIWVYHTGNFKEKIELIRAGLTYVILFFIVCAVLWYFVLIILQNYYNVVLVI